MLKVALRIVNFFLISGFVLATLGFLTIAGLYLYLAQDLPEIDRLRDVELQVPLRVYSKDEKLIAEFGEKRRQPVTYSEVPEAMIQAFLAAEDDRFFVHPGVDYQGLIRAAVDVIRTGKKSQGGSTITMQVARNFFLSKEKTYSRKLNEIFLSLKIEQGLSKEQILELYLNKIYLGNRSYGIAAAAQVYYGRTLNELSLAQTAMVAGLPKAPSKYNPLANPQRALVRRNYVLGRMHTLGFIDDNKYKTAIDEPISAKLHAAGVELYSPYIAEMVRSDIFSKYGDDTYTKGYRVYTTIDSQLQQRATSSLRMALNDFDRRHGYRGPEAQIPLPDNADASTWSKALSGYRTVGNLTPGIVTKVEDKKVNVFLADKQEIEIDWKGLSWARLYIDQNKVGPKLKSASDILHVGDIIRVQRTDERWLLAVLPNVSGAIVSINPNDGAINALSGGFDFFASKFNRVIQAQRQPGSNFKPFVYSAALEKGFTPASIIDDAPIVVKEEDQTEWRPENYSKKFFGPTRLRYALAKSRNLVSIHLLNQVGIKYTIDYAERFGFDKKRLPRALSLALGTASLTPLEVVTAYSVFANGGFLVKPYYIERVEDIDGKVLNSEKRLIACPDCEKLIKAGQQIDESQNAPRVLDERNVYLMVDIMRDVVRYGTGRRAGYTLKRQDIAGKTGTTNDQRDAWFSGFAADVVTTAWVGFDQNESLGNRETGGRAALPMWIDYMKLALKDKPEFFRPEPAGIVTVRIDPVSGLLASTGQEDAIFEMFRSENVPTEYAPEPLAGIEIIDGEEKQQPVEHFSSEELF